ncbi:UDP-glucuronosyltransferase 3A1 [Larimichthys crocea]|uniref:glucuronosyltransferase n=1 Tax=Larimichthys crocea TaxID=215358 RepID=A0A6G0IKR1_LARCR|nr:UDP-glucuronosyltransferase 3A1 [Larimichthys crocea]
MLINHYSILMQVELDRFHATLCILKVYYSSMCSQVLPELPSNFVRIPLLNSQENKDEEKRCPDSSEKVVKTEGQDQTEPIKPPHEKLVSDYEEAIAAISKLVSAETHQGETKEEPTSLQGKEVHQCHPQAPSPALADDRNSEKSLDQEVKNKIHNEFSVALDHEVNLTKMRIALLKGHGLAMVHSLQSRAEETSDSMQKWLEANYFAEMKSIERLSEVVHNHIQAGDKLKYELVLEFTDFYLNGDCLMVASLPPPPRPPTLEKPMASTPTITQLESLYKHLCIVAPSGFISSPEFFNLLRDIISVNWATNTLPEPWSKLNETQLMEIRFKAADAGDTGFINEEQYLQSELWFFNESAPPVPEDPSEPLPYDRLANLRKFFFQLFADHSFSPPRLDYVSMLQYFAADTNPKQGFIRALSVELGQHLKHSSPGTPCQEEATELSSSELDGEYKEEEAPSTSSSFLGDQKVSISALLAVLCHKVTKMKDDYLPPGCLSREEHTEHLVHIFRELGYKPEDCIPFSVLCQHPFTQILMESAKHRQLVNLHQHGHEVRMLLQLGNPVITGFSYESRAETYQKSTWSLGEKYIKEYNGWFLEQQTQFLLGRDNFNGFLKFMGHLSYQCDKLLGDKEIITFLQRQRYDITVVDAFNPCSFILARKLGVHYIAFYPGTLNGPLSIVLPSPVSYIPVFSSQLSNHMNIWGRAKNLFYSFLAPMGQELIWSSFREVAERHLESGSPLGGLEELHQGAELWAFNTDFSLEFPQPLMPYTVLVGGLLNKPPKPPEQDLQLWISNFGEAGFIVVTLGSMVSSVSVDHLLVELVAGFSRIPQGVLWRYDQNRWPSHLDIPPNLRLVDWLPLNDLLGHKKARLFITHGGQNSLLQAVYHALPVLAIPLFGDQFDNVVRAVTKGLGLTIRPTHITRELLSSTIQTLIQDVRFKSSALSLSRIHKSHPVPPALRLTQWVEHILHSGGGTHLRPASLTQPWYQRYLLDLVLLLSLGLLGPVVLCWTFCRNKNNINKHKKIQ